jgi:hypothetical protein
MPVSPVTTFGVFQSLLVNSVSNDGSLPSATRSSILARLNELPREVGLSLDFSNVESTGGLVTVNQLTKSIEVAAGVSGANRVQWKLENFGVPMVVSGTLSDRGVLPGNVGASANAPVPSADIAIQYRLSSTDVWKTFDRNTVLADVSAIQFAATIADQVAPKALPGLHLIAQQE